MKAHGHTIGGPSPTYLSWQAMKGRCLNPDKGSYYREYGGRGITVCDRWLNSFENFLADMGPCPDDLTLDRINNESHYEPGNCRWTTWEQQMLNRRSIRGEHHPNAKLTVDDVSSIRRFARCGVTYRDMASLFGVSSANVGYIVRGEAWRELAGDPGQASRGL